MVSYCVFIGSTLTNSESRHFRYDVSGDVMETKRDAGLICVEDVWKSSMPSRMVM